MFLKGQVAATTDTLSAAQRSHPTSEVRGRSREDPMPEGRQPRGVTPHPRSGAVAERTRLRQCRNSQEELPHVRDQEWGRKELPRVRGQGQQLGGVTHTRGQGRWPGGTTPRPRSRGCVGAGGSRGVNPR